MILVGAMPVPLQEWVLDSAVDKREAARNNPYSEKGNEGGAGEMAQSGKYLLHKHESLSLGPQHPSKIRAQTDGGGARL